MLADTHGAIGYDVALEPDFGLPDVAALRRGKRWRFDAALTLITTPNAPSGRGYTRAELAALCRAQRGVLVLDEAYVDFADEHALPLALEFPHVLVARTFSKAYSLCFQRIGYLVGAPGADRGTRRDSRQLQRERPWPDRRRGNPDGSAVLPGELPEGDTNADDADARR